MADESGVMVRLTREQADAVAEVLSKAEHAGGSTAAARAAAVVLRDARLDHTAKRQQCLGLPYTQHGSHVFAGPPGKRRYVSFPSEEAARLFARSPDMA